MENRTVSAKLYTVALTSNNKLLATKVCTSVSKCVKAILRAIEDVEDKPLREELKADVRRTLRMSLVTCFKNESHFTAVYSNETKTNVVRVEKSYENVGVKLS